MPMQPSSRPAQKKTMARPIGRTPVRMVWLRPHCRTSRRPGKPQAGQAPGRGVYSWSTQGPPGHAPEAAMIRTVLVPLDGSPLAEHALPLALGVARRAGAAVCLAHVRKPGRAEPGPLDAAAARLRQVYDGPVQ